MRRTAAIDNLKRVSIAIRERGATALYLYGSTARDEAREDSDLDLFIEYDPDNRFNAFNLVDMKVFLESELGSSVGLTTRDGLHPMLRPAIEKSAIRVF